MSAPLSPSQAESLPSHAAKAGDLFHLAFYKFVALADPAAVAQALRTLTQAHGDALTGSILVAAEGINGMLAGTSALMDAMEQALWHDSALKGAFTGMVFKRTACKTVPFRRMKVHLKAEIVPLGIEGVDATAMTGINVSPRDWRTLIDQPDVVLLDNRNSFEYRLGRFRNAIDPQVGNFRDFPAYVQAHMAQWQAEGKRVAMYCTGGIRCEKTSAWLVDLGMPVYQLEGGILNYFKEMPDAERDWQGECFVFDNRVALDTRLQETDTTLEDVYTGPPDAPDGEAWRLERARRLNAAA